MAFDAAGAAAMRAPVDTGALRSSIHVVTKDHNGYAAAVGISQSQRKEAVYSDGETVEDELTAKVVVPIHYGIYHELGAANTPARPFLEPGVMAQKGNFDRGVAYVLNNLGESE